MRVLLVGFMVATFVALYVYITKRSLTLFKANFPQVNTKIGTNVFSFCMTLMGLSYFFYKALLEGSESVFVKIFSHVSTLWLVVLLYSFLLFLVIDIFKIITMFLFPKINKWLMENKVFFDAILGRILLGLLVLIIVLGSFYARNVKITEYTITTNKEGLENDSLRIAMVSDIHLGHMIGKEWTQRMVHQINEIEPDVVLLLGDIIDDELEVVRENNMLADIKRIDARYGVHAVAGNHEFYGGALKENPKEFFLDVVKFYEDNGINMLLDEGLLVEDSFCLIGRLDVQSENFLDSPRKNLSELTDDIDFSKFVILMDHQPLEIEKIARKGVDLQLAGHTHGGQMWPINYITRFIYGQYRGMSKLENTNLIISTGYGLWGPIVRVGSRSEIIQIDIKGSGLDGNV